MGTKEVLAVVLEVLVVIEQILFLLSGVPAVTVVALLVTEVA